MLNITFDIRCSECGDLMEYEFVPFVPGTSDPCFKVKPCCISEETKKRIEYVEFDLLPELHEYVLNLSDSIDNFMNLIKNENCFHDSKEQRQEITDYCTSIKSSISDLILDGLK